jgi:hypothetical protein
MAIDWSTPEPSDPTSMGGMGMGSSSSSFSPYSMGMIGGSLGSLFSGLFGGDPGNPYKHAANEYEKYAAQAAGFQNPFYKAGTGAISPYQSYVNKMQDPSKFINDLTKGYSTSPQEQYAQDQAMRAATNAASASGLTGSTPYTQFIEQNASDIANQYQQEWLNNVLGINTQYGQGLQNLLGMGQMSANQLTNIYNQMGNNMAEMTYNKEMARQKQQQDIWGSLGSAAVGIGSLFL